MIDVRSYILSKFPDSSFNSRGRLHTRCPFHDDKNPSFSISDDGLFICGSVRCGIKGNFFQFYKLMEGIDNWKEVHDKLKLNRPKISTNIEDLLGINKKLRNNKLVINEFPISPFIEQVGTIKYLQDRGIDNEVINYFGIEYGTGGNFYKVNITNSLVIPVYDVDGTYYTFQVRKLGSDHSHRWCSPEGNCIQYMLYGGWSVSDTTDNLWIVEGASDVWNLFKYGIQSVGLFTKSASDRQINNIVKLCNKFKLNPVVCMDGDAYGDGFDCNMDIYAELRACGLSPRIVYLWKTEDPGMLSYDNIIKIYDILINHNICSAFEEGCYEGK